MEMTGKVILITGASRGIGAAAARGFAAKGAKVVLLARNAESLGALAGEIGPDALAVPCDVSRYWEVEAAVGAAVSEFGRLDVMINNAGVIEPIAHLASADPDAWNHVIDVNLKGVFNGMRAAIPVMRAQGGGSILTISSGAASHAIEAWSSYCASKAAVKMLTECADLENRAAGIRAIGLSPGTVATQMQREIKASGINPVSRLDWDAHISPETVAQALIWLCGREADVHLGGEVSLRDEAIRAKIGLV